MGSDQNGNIIAEIFGKSRLWQIRNILTIYLLKIPTAFFMACIVYTAPVPKRLQVICLNKTEVSWIHYPPVIEANDQQFELSLCDANSNALQKSWMYLGSRDQPPPWMGQVPCNYFSDKAPFLTFFDIYCSRGALVVLTQGMHLVGIFLSGVVVRYAVRV